MPGTFSPHASRHMRDAGIANYPFPMKSVVGKMFLAFPAHAQPAILHIWYEAHAVVYHFHHVWTPANACNQWTESSLVNVMAIT